MADYVSSVINKADVYVEGIGFIGVGTYQSPELKFLKVECDGAAGAYEVAYGAVEKLEASAKVTVTDEILYSAAAKLNKASIVFSSALYTENGAKGRRDVLTGTLDIKENEAKNGEKLEVEITIAATYWLKEVGISPMVEIDKLKDIVKLNGVDLLEETRSVVGA